MSRLTISPSPAEEIYVRHYPDEDVSIGKAIRAFRETAGRSQQDIATLFGISHQQISKYENGRSSLPVWMLVKIAAYLDMAPHHLLQVALRDQGFFEAQAEFKHGDAVARFESALHTVNALWPEVKRRA